MNEESYEERRIQELTKRKTDCLSYKAIIDAYIDSFDKSREKLVESHEHFNNVYIDGKPFMNDNFEEVEKDMIQTLSILNLTSQYASNAAASCQSSIDDLNRKIESNDA